MSMTYRVVDQADQPEHAGGRFNGEGGVRREWWWQAGPVDSCCCCFSLRAGVAILATNDLFHLGIWTTFYATGYLQKLVHLSLAQLQLVYAHECAGDAAKLDECMQVAHTIEQLEDQSQLFANFPPVFYAQGVIAIIAGVAGLWAVFRANALAAKVYMWTWLPRVLARMVTDFILHAQMKQYGLEQHPAFTVLGELISLCFVVYYVKVAWSYHQRLKGSASHSSSPAHGAENIQLSINGV